MGLSKSFFSDSPKLRKTKIFGAFGKKIGAWDCPKVSFWTAPKIFL
jgi:hypothetical protein